MSTSGTAERTAPVRTRRAETPPSRQPTPSGGWFAALGEKGRGGFRAAFAGNMLDGYVLSIYALAVLPETHGRQFARARARRRCW